LFHQQFTGNMIWKTKCLKSIKHLNNKILSITDLRHKHSQLTTSYKNGYEANNDKALKIIQIIKEAMYLLNAATQTTCIVIA